MKRTITGALSLALLASYANAAPKPLPKDCPRGFVKAWDARASMRSLPKPKEPCVLHGDTGIYICDDRGCARP